MPLRLALLLAAAALAGCSSPAEVREKAGVTATSSARASASASAGATGSARSEKEDNDLYSYAFAYPAEVGAYPELKARLEQRAAADKAELLRAAKEAQADAKANNYPYNPHSLSVEWQRVADIPGFLSLSAQTATYEGGAHGMYGVESLVWDKAAKTALDGIALFRSAQALDAALGKRLCDALNAERTKKREGFDPTAGGNPVIDEFAACHSVKEATVLVGSASGKAFDRITVWYGPYVAGPYAEGAYELDFPMTPAMVEAVKPQYRTAFSAGR